MTILNSSQLANLRKRPQSTKLYLSIYQPKTIFQAQVTGSYNQGDLRINFYAGTTGSWWQIYPNMCARIGSTSGGQEFGELRVRSASGTYIDFAENEIVWQQGMYLTLIDYINVEAVYPRIIQDPSNQTNVIFYKDYDIAYTNQNTNYGTFPCAGPHRAGFIVTGAYSTYWSSTGTYNPLGHSLTFSWAFEGGTPTGSTARDPGFVRYTTPGHYKTRLIVTDSTTGVQDTTYRYVSAYQRPDQGTFNPIEAWEMSDLSGSRGEGGYTARMKIMSILPELEPHALVVIFAEDSYGGNLLSLGGNSQNNESIVFVGYVLSDSIRFNWEQSTMEFDIGSVSEIMKEAEAFSVSCESKAVATTWYELQEMTIQKAIYHYLRWHSTLLNVNDFQYTDDDRYVQYFDSDRQSLFDAVDNFMRNGLLGSVISDRQGKLWAQISHFGLDTPFSDIPISMTLNKQDWMGEPVIQERRDSDVAFVELGGIAYYGVATNTFSALISNAPGSTPLYHGKAERQEGLILLSQAQLNQVAANFLAYKNTPYPEISMPINGNYRNLDIAPQEQLFLVISQSDTIRNVSLQGSPYQISSMNWKYDSTKQNFLPDITLEQMATGTMAETILIPVTPPYVDSGFDYPSLQLPTLPVFNPPSAVGPTAPMTVILHDTARGFIYTLNFDATNPNYLSMNAGLSPTVDPNTANWIGVCPNGAIYAGRMSKTDGWLARAASLGAPWTLISVPGKKIITAAINPTVPEQVGFITGIGGDATFVFHVGTYSSYSSASIIASSNFYDRPHSLSYFSSSGGGWLLTVFDNFIKVNAGGTAVTSSGSKTGIGVAHIRAGASDVLFIEGNASNTKYSFDNLATFTTMTNSGVDIITESSGLSYIKMDCDPTGQFVMTTVSSLGNKNKSSDYGATWAGLPNLPPGVQWCFTYAGYSGSFHRFIVANAVIRYTTDFGNTWIEKTGDINSIAVFPNINMLEAIGF